MEKCADIINNGISHLFIPNAFTPGNDGINDIFRVRGLNVTFQLLSVFNRYGERIFMTTNMDEGWNGMYKGKECDPGTYFYVVKYKERSGTARVKKGDVLLLR